MRDERETRRALRPGLKILVVDDDPALRELLRTTFELVETSVAEAATLREARRLIVRRRPDVVVLDVGLPDGNGLALARELAASSEGEIGIVLLTGTELSDADGLDAGAVDVVRKPFSPLELLAAVERAAGAAGGTSLLAGAQDAKRRDQLLLYADDVRRLLEVERRHRRHIERSYRETLGALAAALEFRDSSTGAHSLRVQRYAWELTGVVAPELLADPSVEFGYLLHDIGKIGIPDSILQKPGPLTAQEREIMQSHTTRGAAILAGVGLLAGHGIAVVRHHHERWDGNGYPDGLADDDIPLPARIFAVADALDAITSDRPYRRAGAWATALAELERGAGTQFDPHVVAAFAGCEARLRELRQRAA